MQKTKEIIEIISKEINVDKEEIHLDTHLVNDLCCDFTDLTHIYIALEDKFQIDVPCYEKGRLETIKELRLLID